MENTDNHLLCLKKLDPDKKSLKYCMHILLNKKKGISVHSQIFNKYFYAFDCIQYNDTLCMHGFILSIANLKKMGRGRGEAQTQLPIIKVHKMNLLFRNIKTSIVRDQYYSITAEIHLVFLLMSLDI